MKTTIKSSRAIRSGSVPVRRGHGYVSDDLVVVSNSRARLPNRSMNTLHPLTSTPRFRSNDDTFFIIYYE